jgi:hypothetical protein
VNKICKMCKKELSINFFYSYKRKMRNGSYKEYYKIYCKKCEKLKRKPEYIKKCNALETTKLIKKEWKIKNYISQKEYCKKYYEKNKSIIKEKVRLSKRIYKRNRRKNDPFFRIRGNISNAILRALKKSKTLKGGKSILKHLEYNIIQLKEHLEKQFDDKMNWQNYGSYWHIDHIIPQSCLPYLSMNDINFKKCWSLSNLRPLDAKTNILEGVNRVRHSVHLEGEI